MAVDKLKVVGAREHNLKGVSVEIPRNSFTVITGLSGSGKSSLAFDTIFAEGQRRYVESLSAYARQFLGQMKKPEVEYIEGLSPAISIDQRGISQNPRSTVGTITEIYDYLRLLWANVGVPHCPKCGDRIERQSAEQIVAAIRRDFDKAAVQVLAPVVDDRKGHHKSLFDQLRKEGYVRVRVDGEERRLDEGQAIELDKNYRHTIEVVVDRLDVKGDVRQRLTDSVETALELSGSMVRVLQGKKKRTYSEEFACVRCGVSIPELKPRMFSFNNPHGACEMCQGLGTFRRVSEDLVIPDRSLSLRQGAIRPWRETGSQYVDQVLDALAEHFHFTLDVPWEGLSDKAKQVLLYGADERVPMRLVGRHMTHEWNRPVEGIIPSLERRYRETQSEWSRHDIEEYMEVRKCPSCNGDRLRPESLGVTVGDRNIVAVTSLSVEQCLAFFDSLELPAREAKIAKEVVKEIKARLAFMRDVGLGYLTIDRASASLAGGEAQRIRLATQIGSGLVGVLYILDEPSIGLHQRDNQRLLRTLERLRDLGNTLIVVEHDEETIRRADHIIDLGPGAGENGGRVVCEGTLEDILACKDSLTGAYLTGRLSIPTPRVRREGSGRRLTIRGARENNLKGIDVELPLGRFIAVTGVSGSGKSTLINEVLYKAAAKSLYGSHDSPGAHDRIEGLEQIDKVIVIDQSPIGRTPRSNPATYTGLFTPIRDLFAMTKDAKVRGYRPGRFSFNVKGGRCESCEGAGIIKIEMHFLPDVYVPCDACGGRRFNEETLEVTYRGKSIYDVLEMTVEEALAFFARVPALERKLKTLFDVGLGYVKLGQPATTLSGGEAQRVKLSTELGKRATGRTLYILDEPTTGLHLDDINKLLRVLSRLTDAGNTVVVIEHNLDVIKCADWLIDLGPEGGDGGGRVIAAGTPEEVARTDTHTGKALRIHMARERERARRADGGIGPRAASKEEAAAHGGTRA
jgi:excinuclease ABC subunit A